MTRSASEFVEQAKATIEGVTPDQLAAELASGDVVVVDVRDSQEREDNGYIPGSIHVAHTDEEHVAVEELAAAVELYTLLARRLLVQ